MNEYENLVEFIEREEAEFQVAEDLNDHDQITFCYNRLAQAYHKLEVLADQTHQTQRKVA